MVAAPVLNPELTAIVTVNVDSERVPSALEALYVGSARNVYGDYLPPTASRWARNLRRMRLMQDIRAALHEGEWAQFDPDGPDPAASVGIGALMRLGMIFGFYNLSDGSERADREFEDTGKSWAWRREGREF